jgi:hypothetical protein
MKSGEIDGYDAVFLSPHKFVGGPGTPGILMMNKSLYRLNSQPPSTCGGGTVAYVNGFNEEVSTKTWAIYIVHGHVLIKNLMNYGVLCAGYTIL